MVSTHLEQLFHPYGLYDRRFYVSLGDGSYDTSAHISDTQRAPTLLDGFEPDLG